MNSNKRLIGIFVALTLSLSKPAFAGISDMESFFNEIANNPVNNSVSGAQKFRGQTRDYWSGGNLLVRIPSKTYQLATFDPPKISAGCSGIDIYGGSFSFINSDQLVQMLQNIGNNAAGAIFSLALESVSPQLNSVIKFFQDMANKINALNINSCEAAKGIVISAKSSSLGKDMRATLAGLGSQVTGVGTDWSNMVEKFQESGSNAQQDTLASAKSSSELTADEKMWLEPGNLVYKALGRITESGSALSENEKKIIQSMVGTIVLKADTSTPGEVNMKAKEFFPLSNNPLSDYMGGTDSPTVSITVYSCNDSVECSGIDGSTETIDVVSLRKVIHDRIMTIKDKVMSRSGGVNVTDYEILNISYLPIWNMIEAAYRTGDVLSTLNNSEELIALSYLLGVLDRALNQVRIGLGAYKASNQNAGIESAIRTLDERIILLRSDLRKEFYSSQHKFSVFLTSQQALKQQTFLVRERTARLLKMRDGK